MLVATHPGNFHADDVFAVATLGLALGELDVVRTRDEALTARARNSRCAHPARAAGGRSWRRLA